MLIHRLASILALSATASSLAYDGPPPTPTAHVPNTNILGWTPKPTREPQVPMKPLRRNANDALCGYVEGLAAYPISCAHGSCQSNTALSWFGCCSSDDNNSCNMVTRCIASASVPACLADPACSEDQHAMRCTETSAPFCVQVNTVRAQATLSHFVCAPAATVLALRAEPTGGASASGDTASTATKTTGDGHGEGATGSNDGVTPTAGSRDGSGGLGKAATSSLSTGGAAAGTVQTARAVVGIAGGLVGLVAALF